MPTPFQSGDIFDERSSQSGVITHRGASGVFIEDIVTENVIGFTGTVVCFAQYNNFLYLLNGGSLARHIQEYDSNGDYIRTVVTEIDDSDPVQNPDGLSAGQLVMSRFTIDSQGNIYGGGQANSQRVWKWDNAGVFQETYDPVNTSGQQNSILINPIDDCDLIVVNNVSGASIGTIWRYNPCTSTLTDTLTCPEGGGSFPSDFHVSGKLYKAIGGPPGSAELRVYDSGWGAFTDTLITMPGGLVTSYIIRTTDDDDIVWIWSAPSTSGSTSCDFSIFQYQISTDTVLISPISISTNDCVEAAHVWKSPLVTPRMFGFVTLIGAN